MLRHMNGFQRKMSKQRHKYKDSFWLIKFMRFVHDWCGLIQAALILFASRSILFYRFASFNENEQIQWKPTWTCIILDLIGQLMNVLSHVSCKCFRFFGHFNLYRKVDDRLFRDIPVRCASISCRFLGINLYAKGH